MITVLCALEKSVYHQIPGIDVYDKNKDAYTYDGCGLVIAHPPCQQCSKLKHFAAYNKLEKELAFFCLEKIQKNGGILEHPHGSSFFKEAGIKPTIIVDQSWWGFPAQKRTSLYFNECIPLELPKIFFPPTKTVQRMDKSHRSITVLPFATWLINSVQNKISLP
ncbi:hypothetical protein D0809_16795 [Flavobacterium circumlabens]|uniref:Uncharacterized protein n=1 Tax=Flavobacterium circumlabens TaxID=2133765 RepID=A0A4Y7UBD8_9FLAO|nr:hypothetical protein [Flavobacterium circumlabens]TCN55500.1 hypothetical protein EV142_106189 [Flavobacterium circumlabens]TEB43092.1 hypothetical protein D0809_16795 [Flavobacterium circumlabens]